MRKVVVIGVALGLIAIAVGVVGRTIGSRRQQDAAAAADEAARAAVPRDARTRLATGDRAEVTATGVIKPMVGAEVRVGSRLSGVVTRLAVRIGDRVQKGQILAELDARELMARRDEAAAALATADANRRYAHADRQRKRELCDAQLLPPSDLDLADRAAIVADTQHAQARATLDYATTQLGYARIVAPIDGTVASISTQEGETVAASFATPTFVTLLDLSRLEVWAYVDETDIGRIRRGQRARFSVDTYGDQTFDGRVTAIYPQAQIRDNVVNYVTVVRFTPPRDRILRPDMTAMVRVATEPPR